MNLAQLYFRIAFAAAAGAPLNSLHFLLRSFFFVSGPAAAATGPLSCLTINDGLYAALYQPCRSLFSFAGRLSCARRVLNCREAQLLALLRPLEDTDCWNGLHLFLRLYILLRSSIPPPRNLSAAANY